MPIRTRSLRWPAAAALVIALGTAGCTDSAHTGPQPPGHGLNTAVPGGPTGTTGTTGAASADVRLTAFHSCDDARTSLQQAAALAGAPRGANPAPGAVPTSSGPATDQSQKAAAPGAAQAPGAAVAAPPQQFDARTPDSPTTPDHSTTNINEAGVDEPDLVKTDGRRIVSLRRGWIYVADAKAMTMVGGTPLSGGQATDQQLLLVGDKALVLGRDPRGRSAVSLVDISGSPRVVDTFTIAGDYIDARLIGSTARVVVHSEPRFTQTNDWLPSYSSTSSGSGTVGCDHITHPAVYSGTSMLTLLTFDLSAPNLGTGRPLTVVADGNIVYATGSTLYVADDLSRWQAVPLIAPLPNTVPNASGRQPTMPPARLPAVHTELYEFDISGTDQPRYVAAGSVPGWPVNQYSMSEYQGNLRIATTTGTSSTVYVLSADAAARTTGTLRQIGALTGLGHGERLYGVRYEGPVAYVVTFRQTDPLFTIDLRDPTAPREVGELKLTGYSAYLHPVDDKTLIGLGQAANTSGVVQGTQVSLFDVSDPAAPRLKARFVAPGAHSTAENDPHAFLYWPKTGMLVLPLAGPNGHTLSTIGGAMVLHIGTDSITETGVIGLPRSRGDFGTAGDVQRITRALVVDDTLWTVSGAGLLATNGATLEDMGWIPYP